MLAAGYELFVPVHGLPADKNAVARNIEYLSAARQAVGNGLTGDAFKNSCCSGIPNASVRWR